MDPNQTVAGGLRTRLRRDPVIGLDERVWGYGIELMLDEESTPVADRTALLHELYLELELENLVADSTVFIPALESMITGELPQMHQGGRLVLDLPADFADQPDAERRTAAMHSAGTELALRGFSGTPNQTRLLTLLDYVTINPHELGEYMPNLVQLVHSVGVRVIAEHVADVETYDLCASAGVDALRGSVTERAASIAAHRPRVLRAGQVQCLAILHLLDQPEANLARVGDVIDTDPMLTVRVLHLVNSGAFALRAKVDAVRHAVVLLGPRELSGLVTSVALDTQQGSMHRLWQILTRALACETLADDSAAYTVGMLAGLIDAIGVPMDDVLEKAGVSPAVAHAVRYHSGELGHALGAILAHEAGNLEALAETGFDPLDVSDVYLASLAEALRTAEAIGH